MTSAPEPYDLSPDDVGQLVGVHTDTVKRWAIRRQIPGVKLPGGHWRFRASEVTAHIESLRNDATTTEATA